ncbi:MAG: DUF4625 domain-containing protein [Bacteroidales bacterium]|nr:DUF4625 domain-containing protein [Bacteroidales bacterium]
MKKNIVKYILTVIVSTVIFAGCGNKNDIAKPQIVLTEVGENNSKIAECGEELHLEADIIAEGLIKSINIEIHQEKEGGREIEKSYTSGKYIGLKNTVFHEHIDIPADMPVGEYHLHFTVVDKENQTAMKEAHINIVAKSK